MSAPVLCISIPHVAEAENDQEQLLGEVHNKAHNKYICAFLYWLLPGQWNFKVILSPKEKKITVTVLNKCINPWLFPRPVHMRARENVMPPPSVNINFVISELQKSKNCKGITAIEIIMDRGKRDSKLS